MKSLLKFATVAVVALFATAPTWAAESEGAGKTYNVGGVQVTDIVVGDGEEATNRKRVKVHYTGWTMDGKKFDSSLDRNLPFTFKLGEGSVISGWDIGVKGMRVGGKRELIIPPHLGYGARGAGDAIPPNATLKFEVELLGFAKPLYTDIDNAELKELLLRGVPIVDLRREEEWKQTGIVEGSHMITAFNGRGKYMPSFLPAFNKVAGREDEVIVICRTGNRTSTIAKALTRNVGYKKVYNVEHGITKWIADGNPVVKP